MAQIIGNSLSDNSVKKDAWLGANKKQEQTNQKIYNKINKINSNLKTKDEIIEELQQALIELDGRIIVLEADVSMLKDEVIHLKQCDNTQLQAISNLEIIASKRIRNVYIWSIIMTLINLGIYCYLVFGGFISFG